MTTLVIATRNLHKVGEIRAVLGGEAQYLDLSDYPGAPTVVEDAETFTGNATKKAVELAAWVSKSNSTEERMGSEQMFVLADDSGLAVDALSGAPGVKSARFAALESGGVANSTDTENNAKLLRLLEGVALEGRTARFRCVLALTPVLQPPMKSASPVCFANEFEMQTELFEGTCEGRIGFERRGLGGFGYDPLFMPNGYQETFAELGEAIKNQLSHRARALAKLKARLASLTSR